MKHLLRTLLVAVLCMATSEAFAYYDFYEDGIYYLFKDGGVVVSCVGDPTKSDRNKYSGEIVIPETVIHNGLTYNVVGIFTYAFYGCTDLTSITIPNSVTSIGSATFYGCTGLTSVTIPNSVTSIDYQAFSYCSGLTSVTIPNSVTSIGQAAFSRCTGLTSVTIPNSVTSIGQAAFSGCSGLTSIEIPNSVTSIGQAAFSGCTGLTSVVFNAKKCTSCGSYDYPAFPSTITTLTIGNEVETIPEYTFRKCTGLTSVHINDLAAWCGISFASPNDNPLRYAKHLYLNGEEIGEEITKLVIPESVTSICGAAFYGRTGLTSVSIPNSVTSIGGYAFYGCSGLTSVSIPNSVTSINDYAFSGCTGLKKLKILDGENSIFIGRYNFTGSPLETLYLGRNISDVSFYISSEVSFYNSVTCQCTSLVDITFGKQYTEIPESAFEGCSQISEIKGGNGVTSIGQRAFYGCERLKSFYIPESVKKIENCTFSGCKRLSEVRIGSGVEEIGDSVFYNCPLTHIYNYAEYPQNCGKGTFSIVKYYCKLFIKEDSQDLYRVHADWSAFNIQPLDSEALPVGDIKASQGNTRPYYDLSGRRINGNKKLHKGINIVNGKKILVR